MKITYPMLRYTTLLLYTIIYAPDNGGTRQSLLRKLRSASSSGGIFRLLRYFLRALTVPESLRGSADRTVSIIAIWLVISLMLRVIIARFWGLSRGKCPFSKENLP
jgi:hypothetical protein